MRNLLRLCKHTCSAFIGSAALYLLISPLPQSASASMKIDTTPIDLTQAITLALAHEPQWLSLQKQIAAEQESRIQARSQLLPSIALTGQTAKSETEVGNIDSDGNTRSLSLGITQPLFRLDTWFQYQASKENHQQLAHQLNASYQRFVVDVAQTYLEVLRAQSQLIFTEAELSAIRQQLEQAQQRFKVGLIAITDVHEAQAAYDLAEVNQIAAATDLDIAYENLARLTSSPVAAIQPVRDSLPITNPTPNNMSAWVTLAQAKSPTILAAKAAKRASKENLRSARSLYMPQINLFANRSDARAIDAVSDAETTQVGIEFTQPIFQGLNTLSTNRQVRLEYLAASDDLVAQIKDSTQITRNLFRSVQTDVLRVSARQQAIKSSQSALEATEAGYEVGTRNVVDVLNAQRSLFAAKRDYATARYDFILHTLQLKETVGQVTAEEIQALNQWLH